ncbi:MAG: hypothetical protein KKB79_03385 [Nanoarchaeota archaeon]|nr:hypothetical protein [Nanoarchaeota archaeon]
MAKGDYYNKFVYEDSAGWLLFWLIFAPPIGYLMLMFGMTKRPFLTEDQEEIIQKEERTIREWWNEHNKVLLIVLALILLLFILGIIFL